MSPTKTSERTIIRVKDLADQPAHPFVLLPGGLDRVIIACGAITVVDECIQAYATLGDAQRKSPLLFSAPLANGFVFLDRALCELETVEVGLRRMAADEKEAVKLHEELYGDSHDHGDKAAKKPGTLSILRPPKDDDDPDFQPPSPGQYL